MTAAGYTTVLNLGAYAITLLLAITPRRMWPVLVWLGLNLLLNISAYFILADGDPRKNFVWLLIPSFLQLLIFLLARGVRLWRDDDNPLLFHAGWQLGGLATFIILTFFDGYDYTWWNWMIAIPVNLFIAELWPVFWFILRPVFGY
jgi:hypothetical protein